MPSNPRESRSKSGTKTPKAMTRSRSGKIKAAPLAGAAPVRFADIQNLLDALAPPSDTNINGAPHKRFWRNAPTNTRDGFVNFDTSNWGQDGRLVTPGHPETSNLYLALAGQTPFDGSAQSQMPDVDADPLATLAGQEQLATVATWITNGAPA
ncbi:hypothetical protein GGI64_004112 [Rhizobium leguminosarum]|uniref:Uncharacterized protein n=1 Tax=Rhizobium leguminosarum TaxID=384 RepID=A0A7Z0E0Y2_RHILE|nr:hypothetical protein [Rhizobium leguminosarum]NYJ13031.1 hypothetical protein [Rhizobium leguminosarum]